MKNHVKVEKPSKIWGKVQGDASSYGSSRIALTNILGQQCVHLIINVDFDFSHYH